MPIALIVDDIEENLYLLRVLLSANGYDVVAAHNGAEALALARTTKPDLIITDLLMPVMDGFTLCRTCRTTPELADVPIIVYTSTYTDPEDETLALNQGADLFLIKPLDAPDLLKAIDELMRKHAADSRPRRPLPDESESLIRQYNAALVRKLEDKLEQIGASQRKFRAIFEAASQGIITVSADGVIGAVNQRIEEMFGYDRADLTGQPLEMLLPERFRERHVRHRSQYFSQLSVRAMGGGMELLGRRKDGSEFPLEIGLSYIQDSHGIEAIGLVTDITERQRAEKALLQEKTFSDAVIGAIPGIFLFQDEDGKNLRWNRNSEMLARFAPSEVAPLGNVADEYKNAARQAIHEVFTKGFGEVEAEMLAKDGRRVPYYFSGVRVDLEGKPYLAAIGVDITERKQADEAIRRSETELRSFVEHAPYGIGRTSVQEDRFLSANPALVKMLGYRSEAEVLASRVSRDLYFETDSRQPTRADYFSGVESAWKRKDGKPIHVRASGRRLSGNEQGDIIEIIVEDVTARRALEEQLRQAHKMEALGRLAGSVAHDFNNLLAVIMGYSELLSTTMGADGSSRERIEIIKKAGERAASLTGQLLAFSRRQVMQPKVINLNSLVMETTTMLRHLMGEDIEQCVALDPNLGRTKADPGQMVQVIMNLAVNSRDAMPRGGKLTIETASVVFEEETVMQNVPVPAGHYVMLSVSDTGTGMDAETQAHLFEPFFTSKPLGKGTGLGLATVLGIVKQSGGFIFAESEQGKGTTFKVYLPLVEQVAEAAAARTSPREAGLGSETILLVEDEIVFRDLLSSGLQSNGYKVLVGDNGVDALQVAEQYQGTIRVLVTDVIMPQMSGPELARRLKEVRPEIRVLYMSGYTDDKLGDISELDSECGLLQKPFYIDQLAEKIHELLRGRSAAPPEPQRNESLQPKRAVGVRTPLTRREGQKTRDELVPGQDR